MNEDLSSSCKLTLISAPAGFGKITVVSEWIANCGMPVAWLSLDEGDNDPARFISYLVKALQTIQAGIGEGLLAALQSSQQLQIEIILTSLLNDISTIPENFLLVLDDYHSIDSRPVDQSLVFFIEHQPPQLHLVIATREDPGLPLVRLRAADLRFNPTEAAEFLNKIIGLNLSKEGIASFIQAFTGGHRFVLDYLVEEVLQHKPEGIHSFLLKTAILDRLSCSLCGAVTGQAATGIGNICKYIFRNIRVMNFVIFILMPSLLIIRN